MSNLPTVVTPNTSLVVSPIFSALAKLPRRAVDTMSLASAMRFIADDTPRSIIGNVNDDTILQVCPGFSLRGLKGLEEWREAQDNASILQEMNFMDRKDMIGVPLGWGLKLVSKKPTDFQECIVARDVKTNRGIETQEFNVRYMIVIGFKPKGSDEIVAYSHILATSYKVMSNRYQGILKVGYEAGTFDKVQWEFKNHTAKDGISRTEVTMVYYGENKQPLVKSA